MQSSLKIKSKKRLIISAIVLAIVFVMISMSIGPLPPLQQLLNPKTGVWQPPLPQYATGIQYFNLTINGTPTSIVQFNEPDGFIGIASNTTVGLYFMQGYLEAKYRLEEMTIFKRTALGTLAQVVGPSAASMDEFNRQLMNLQIAREEVKNLTKSGYEYQAINSFVNGINVYISVALIQRNLPILFKLLNFQPQYWNITDVFAIQQFFLWQNSAGGTDPLTFNYALQKMPESVIQAFYPAYPAGVQNPIVPYSLNPGIYNETGDIGNLSLYTPSYGYPASGLALADSSLVNYMSSVTSEVSSLGTKYLGGSDSFMMSEPSSRSFSNDWAVNGVKTHNSSALLSNDPHLTTSVPSIWMGFQLVSPGMNVVGVTFPSFPGIVLGHNSNIAWGATNAQVQETYFYAETVNSTNPYLYYSNGDWKHFHVINETIQIADSASRTIKVESANNGVVLENKPTAIAMDWTGLSPTNELAFFLNIDRASTVKEFEHNLTLYFKTGIQNFAVADSQGNIGIFPYGNYPVISGGNPRGILPGTGQYNWKGFIPVSQLPHLYDPARGFVFSANQITVSSNYPYYIGWDYESGYRADQIYTMLNSTSSFDLKKMQNVQLTVHDFTTDVFLKLLLSALKNSGMTDSPGYGSLLNWNGNMTVNSTAATIYYFWQQHLVNDTFLPYLQYYNITSSEGLYQNSFFLGSDATYHGPLIEDLVNWTLNDPSVHWFNNPLTGQTRNLSTVMLLAYNQTISQLSASSAVNLQWGNFHKRVLSSIFGISSFNTNEIPAAGDSNTPNAAYGLVSDFGPSWRQDVNMSQPVKGQGIYPGGISENPLSQYYDNTFNPWNEGNYYLLIPAGAPVEFYYLYQGGVLP